MVDKAPKKTISRKDKVLFNDVAIDEMWLIHAPDTLLAANQPALVANIHNQTDR